MSRMARSAPCTRLAKNPPRMRTSTRDVFLGVLAGFTAPAALLVWVV